MSFADYMIAILKNNARIRKTLYDKTFIFKRTGYSKLKFFYKKASAEQLRKVKDKMAVQNHRKILIRVAALIIALTIVVLLFFFLRPLLNYLAN